MALNELDMLRAFAAQVSNASDSVYGESADIVLSCDNGKRWIVFPVVPETLPEVTIAQNNETFQGVRGDLMLIGTLGLRQLSLELLLPECRMRYAFCRPEGASAFEVLSFIDENRALNIPFRINIVYPNGLTYLNMACLIQSTSYTVDNVGDYHLKLDLIEYRFASDLAKLPARG